MAYLYSKSITIDHTKCGSTTSTNFPMLFSTTHADFKTVGNGGKVENSSGYDLVFFSDASLINPLKFEIEKYVASTGQFIAWVKIPSLSHTTDTVIYIGFGNSSISTSQADPTAVWDSNFKLVAHLGDGTTLSLNDSTSNGNTLTNNNTVGASASGKISGAGQFDAASSRYLSHVDHSSLQMVSDFTLEAWINYTGAGAERDIVSKAISGGAQRDYALDIQVSSGKLRTYFTQGASVFRVLESPGGLSTGVLTHVVGTYNGATQRLYVNGSQVSSRSQTGNVDTTAGAVAIGRLGSDNSAYFDGQIDEVRISNVERSASWILAEYNNQSSPSTFYALTDGVVLQGGQYFPPAF